MYFIIPGRLPVYVLFEYISLNHRQYFYVVEINVKQFLGSVPIFLLELEPFRHEAKMPHAETVRRSYIGTDTFSVLLFISADRQTDM